MVQDKVNEVKKLREKFKDIIMIGDGINDAPALATATVGIAMGAKGTAISAEAADVVLLIDDVTKVSDVINIGKETIKVAKQSIFFGMGISFLFDDFCQFRFDSSFGRSFVSGSIGYRSNIECSKSKVINSLVVILLNNASVQ